MRWKPQTSYNCVWQVISITFVVLAVSSKLLSLVPLRWAISVWGEG